MNNITFKTIFAALLAPLFLSACSDDDDELKTGGGNPTITVEEIQPAQMGDSITVNVNCQDDIALSTLKASLRYSDEEVQSLTMRTKDNGSYQLRLYVPYYKEVPDGNATLHLTLQNIEFTKEEKDVEIPITRPHFDHLTLYVNSTTQYRMVPDADNPYLFRCTVNSPSSTTVPAYVIAPAMGSNGNEVTFGQGNMGITQGVTDAIAFTGTHKGSFECTFNTLTYEYSPVYDPSTAAQELPFSMEKLDYDGKFVQGRRYIFSVPEALQQLMARFWIDPDFFKANGDGSYTFNAVDGYYHLKVNTQRMGLQVWATDESGNTLSLADDGSGAVWIIGDDGISKPAYSLISGQGWWTDTDHALCMAQVQPKVYRITLTVGQQLRAGGINFKFFGQAGWGIELKGSASSHHVTSQSDIFLVGDGNGHDDGNLYLSSDDAIKDGETYVLTLDLTGGCDKALLKAEKQ